MKETRTLSGAFEIRAGEPGGSAREVIVGYGARFNEFSSILGGMFRERIVPGAFDDVLGDDVRGLFNHDMNLVLGRTASKSVRIFVDEKGLRYEIDPPATELGRTVVELLRRGDVDGSSFSFALPEEGGDVWAEGADGVPERTILRFARLYDLGPVTFPAYPTASSGIEEGRSSEGASVALERYLQEKETKNHNQTSDSLRLRLKRMSLI